MQKAPHANRERCLFFTTSRRAELGCVVPVATTPIGERIRVAVVARFKREHAPDNHRM